MRAGDGTFPIALRRCLAFSFVLRLLDLDLRRLLGRGLCLVFLCLFFIASLLFGLLEIIFFNINLIFNRVFFVFLILVCREEALLCNFILFLFFFGCGERNLMITCLDLLYWFKLLLLVQLLLDYSLIFFFFLFNRRPIFAIFLQLINFVFLASFLFSFFEDRLIILHYFLRFSK